MRASSALRPIGFRPSEISAMVNQVVLDQHAEETAFLWTQRNRAVTAAQYALKDLARLDERVEAHVDGLRVAGSEGWRTALAQLDAGPGEVFAGSVLAFESGVPEMVNKALEVGCSAPLLARALISALGWMQPDKAAREAKRLIPSQSPELRRAGIAGMAVHRSDPGTVLAPAIADESPRVAGRSMKAAGELGRTDLLGNLMARILDSVEDCRFWAAWAAGRLGERRSSDTIRVLLATAEAGGPLAERALDLALRVMGIEEGHVWREQLARQPATLRLAVIGAGVIGDPATIPELIAQMENAELARAAGSAFSMITGADLGYDDLDGDPPAAVDESPNEDAGGAILQDLDADLSWPLPSAVAAWWSRRAAQYVPGVRYILGKPMSEQSLREALIAGRQNQRAAAALELAVRHPAEPLFETRERAQRQQRKLAQ